MRAAKELNPTEFALVVHLLDEQIFAGVNDRLHHHVDLADLALKLDDLAAFVDGRRHRHRAGDVLAGLQGGQGLGGMIGDRRIDMHRVHVRVFQQLFVLGIACLDAELIANLVHLGFVAPADGVHLGNRDDFDKWE